MPGRPFTSTISRISSKSTNTNTASSSCLLYSPRFRRFHTTAIPSSDQQGQSQTISSPPQTISLLPPKTKTPSFARKPKPGSRSIWKSPIPTGKIPAYDEALKYIRADARKLARESKTLAFIIKAKEAEIKTTNDTLFENPGLNKLRQKLEILHIQSKINLPEVRFAFKMGRYPLEQPVFRHLAEQKWRKDGALDLLMERIYQMHVVPDLLPEFHPTVDLRVQFPWSTEHRTMSERRREKSGWYTIEPGRFLTSKQTRNAPRVATTAFHTDVRLYTLIMLDPDVPHEESQSFQTYLHWLKPNIALSASRRNIKIHPSNGALDQGSKETSKVQGSEEEKASGKLVLNAMATLAGDTLYIPPHPQRGTPYHRYVILLLPHLDPQEHLDIPAFKDDHRMGFNLREFAAQWGLALGPGGGADMWRQVWDEDVSDVYNSVLRVPEPIYQRPRKSDFFNQLSERRPKYAL